MYDKNMIKDLIRQHQQSNTVQTGTAMTDLDEFVGTLSEEERKNLGQDQDFNHTKQVYLEHFIMFLAVASDDGRKFATGPGRRLAQELLDCARMAKRNANRPPQPDNSELQKEMAEQKQMFAKVLEANEALTNQVEDLTKRLEGQETKETPEGAINAKRTTK